MRSGLERVREPAEPSQDDASEGQRRAVRKRARLVLRAATPQRAGPGPGPAEWSLRAARGRAFDQHHLRVGQQVPTGVASADKALATLPSWTSFAREAVKGTGLPFALCSFALGS